MPNHVRGVASALLFIFLSGCSFETGHAPPPPPVAKVTPAVFTGERAGPTRPRTIIHKTDITDLLKGRVPVKIYTGQIRLAQNGMYFSDFSILLLTDDDRPTVILVMGPWIDFYGHAFEGVGDKSADGTLSFDRTFAGATGPLIINPATQKGSWKRGQNLISLTKVREVSVSSFAGAGSPQAP